MEIIGLLIFCIIAYGFYKFLKLLGEIVLIPVCVIFSIIGALWVITQIP